MKSIILLISLESSFSVTKTQNANAKEDQKWTKSIRKLLLHPQNPVGL